MRGQETTVPAAAVAMSETRRTLAFVTVAIAVVLEVADSTIVNTALPAIRTALGATPAAMQWIVAGYLLALGSLLLLGGRLGDAFGHRRVFLSGVAAFVSASALCGLAQTPGQLVAARVVQGIAASIMAPQSMAIVQLLFTPLERVSRLAYFGVIVGLSAIVGPIVGGMLIEANWLGLGWRLIFLINLPVGALALALGSANLPRHEPLGELRLDPSGAALFAAGFGAILFALIDGGKAGIGMASAALLGGGGALVAIGVERARSRRRHGRPAAIEPSLFALRSFRWGVAAALAFSAGSIGFLLVFAVSLQQGLGLDPLRTALVHIPFGLGVMVGVGVLGPKLLPRFGRALSIAGGLIMASGAFAALRLIASGDGGGPLLLTMLAFAGIGMGTLSGPLGPIVVADVDRAHAGTASATLRTAQQLGGAFGIAIVGAIYFAAGGGAAARLAGLHPAGYAVVALLALSILSASRLPRDIFGARRSPGS